MSKGMDVEKLNAFLAGRAEDAGCDCGCLDAAASGAGVGAPAEALTDVGGRGVSSAKTAKRRYLAVAQDKAGKYGLEHSDHTPCDARTPDSCPHNKKAQRADDLSGTEWAKNPNGGVSPVKCEKGKRIGESCNDLSDKEWEALDDDIGDAVRGFTGDYTDFDYSGDDLTGNFSGIECEEGESEIGKNEDGKWTVQQEIVPLDGQGRFDKDREAFNKHMESMGVGIDKLEFDADDIKGFKREYSGSNDYYGHLEAHGKIGCLSHLVVTDPEKFQAFKDSYKAGGSRRSQKLDEDDREDREWRASPEYRQHMAEMKKNYPNMFAE